MKIAWIYWDDSDDEARGTPPYFSKTKPESYYHNVQMIVYAVVEE